MTQTAKGRVINKLALVLLSIVVLELVLIGNQVQPVKGIKKKIYLKKLKKLLPLLALVKPKKKIILLPIPIPMFKHQGHQQQQQHRPTGHQQQPGYMMMPSSLPMGSEGMMILDAPSPFGPMASNASEPSPMLLMPSMSMTIQSDSSGGSAIELSTNLASSANNRSSPLLQSKRPQQQQQQQQYELSSFEEPASHTDGDHYYRSPWANRAPLTSPARLIDRFRPAKVQSEPQARPLRPQQLQQRPQQPPARPPVQLQVPAMVTIKNQWMPSPPRQQQQQQQQQQLELEEMVSVGPQQMMPVYQTPDGHLHLSPPTERPAGQRPSELRQQPEKVQQVQEGADSAGDNDSEVQTVAGLMEAPPAATKSGRLVSPVAKGKQAASKRKPGAAY